MTKKRNYFLSVLVLMLFFCSSCVSYQKFGQHTSRGQENQTVDSSKTNAAGVNSTLDNYILGIEDMNKQKYVQTLEEAVVSPPPQSNASQLVELDKSTKSIKQEQQPKSAVDRLDFELEIRETQEMRNYFHYYTQKKQQTFQRWLERAEQYLPYIKKVFNTHGLPDDLIFLPFAESGFNPIAYSHAGAAGMWQFMSGTARNYDLQVSWWIDERRDPYKSTRAAAKHLKRLYKKFNNWYLVLAAYNTGQYHIKRALRNSDKSTYFQLASSTNFLYRETKMYVPKFMAILKIVKNLEELGFEELELEPYQEPNKLRVDAGTDLYALAKSLGWGWSTFRERNPFFKRRMSPPNKELFVYLPQKYNKQAKKFLNKSSSSPYADYKRYRIRNGDSWWEISRQFQVPVRVLKDVNNYTSNHLRPGQYIMVPITAEHLADSKNKHGENRYRRQYSVQKGESLWEIAQRFKCSLDSLRKANNISPNSDKLQVGENLIVPIKSSQLQKRKLARKRANYKVQKGDSLWSISKNFGVSIQTLKQANALSGNRLKAGTKLYIPDITQKQTRHARKKAESAHASIVKYIVKKGDNLWDIARKFGVEHSQILSWNNINSGDLIHPGDKLNIHLK